MSTHLVADGALMNERATAIWALLAGELTGAVTVLTLGRAGSLPLFASDLPINLLSHFTIAAGIWGVLVILAWILSPQLWRTRQHTRTKLHFLGVICVVAVCVSVATDLFQSPGAVAFAKSTLSPFWTVLVQSCGLLAGFWGATYLHMQIAGRNVPQVTPPPRFGRG